MMNPLIYPCRVIHSVVLSVLFITALSGQVNLVTFTQTSGGGQGEGDFSLDFALGQTVSYPIENSLIIGNIGVLQVITDLISSQEDLALEKILVYPNPMIDQLVIMTDCKKQLNLILSDVSGRVVYSKNRIGCSEILDVDTLPTGTYTLKIFTDNNSNNYQLIKI